MKTNTVISVFSALFAAGAAVATPAVSNVSFSHDPAERTVIVNYDLSESAIVTVDVKTNGVSIGSTGLQATCGDVNRIVEAGTGKTVCWYAERGWPDRRLEAGTVTVDVKAWTTNAPPKYCVVDLTGKNGAPVGSKYYCDDLDVTNRIYKTDYLVFRYIPAKDVIFPMGMPKYNWYHDDNLLNCHRVKLTNDYYIAIYELTQGQYRNVSGNYAVSISLWPDTPTHPVDSYLYMNFRGIGKFWPDDGHSSETSTGGSGTMLNIFREKLDLPTLDFPTEAEWEFACRAGTAEHRYDGVDADGAGNIAAPNNLAWSYHNTPTDSGYKRPQEVGLLQPNGFGLYDMLGNVWEMCLDYYGVYPAAQNSDAVPNAIAPVGPEQDINGNTGASALRVKRGGSVDDTSATLLSYERQGQPMDSGAYPTDSTRPLRFGYRLVFVP